MRTQRRPWIELPDVVRQDVEHRLGAAVQSFEERPGGFSFGVLGVATLSTGEQVFIKAVTDDTANAHDYRIEAVIAAALPNTVPTPRLRFTCEQAGWLLLCFDLAPGDLPHEPWRPGELAAALEALAVCARELTPSPIGGLPTLAGRMTGRCETWRALERHGVWDGLTVDGIGAWERAHLPRLAAVEATWAELAVGETLLHFDPRFDNILISPGGTAQLVDWGRACTGPAWSDLVCLLLQSDLGDADPAEIFAAHPAGQTADPGHVDGFLVALASYWTHTAALPGLAHAPHLRDRREYSRRATIAWLQRRWS
ncbi:aminoglycoside phosphotransferase [Planomonospora sphaerica]|uniref:Aminoglycoside phosphotransferase n=1 Tax=Planomonospora sphaerica TaxID=161355 RepID=A0A161LN06_9ACTN|nr:phosphotransferase [Planomonospora sphaerica]GAT68875.1 aminoglycoside phosphotransferase [Planomonospora sphaerica]